ncbi:hypothetical protein A8C75_08315 [Marinobacterium aestuarii]|uniref:GDP-perosamine synthase n=1 Tax=Marinobacterium aestuarii TaxID=1821621 RepID=A0A1A9EXF1_9GAMM|nr:aminotransferase class I/II-fold pyridoxal phosphate-dependent enzyme [Marinobacterium aestuarii]ANG62492.1 hypothetical protein A8C75_08315 [Marinobacterium aestuarii]
MEVKPAFIPVAMPLFGEEEQQAIQRPLASGWVTQGREVAAFEAAFADYVGADHACAVSSCTAALHLALHVLGVGPGDEVITVSHSFVATANAIRYCGALPVFVDIDPISFNMDPAGVEAALSPRTKAILVVHQLGMPADLLSILEIAKSRGVPVVEDAACAIGSEILTGDRWQRIGAPLGEIVCFSFHPRKVITTGDGGMLTTNNPELAERLSKLRQHAMDVNDRTRHQANSVIFESYPELGFNYRMTDIQGAMGREQLKRLSYIVTRRRELAGYYHRELTSVSGLLLPQEASWARTNWQSYCVRLPAHVNQKAVMQSMLDEGIATRRGVMCIHREASYPEGCWRSVDLSSNPRDTTGHRHAAGDESLRESEAAQDHCIMLPLYPQLTLEQQQRVVQALQRAVTAIRVQDAPSKCRERIEMNTDPASTFKKEPAAASGNAPMISIVTPAYNEAKNLPVLYQRLCQVLDEAALNWEWVLVDDHSGDDTFEVITELAQHDPRVKGYRLARNSGSHLALTCCLNHVRGNCTIALAADLQDPPEVIPELLAQWQEGYQVVWAARARREGESWLTKGAARLYYMMMRKVLGFRDMPANGADFFLLDRQVVKALSKFGEQNISLLALLTWMGFRQTAIQYDKQARLNGRSGWTLGRKLKLLIDSVTAFSYLPIRAISYFGILVAFIGFSYALFVIYNALTGTPPQGWTTLIVIVLFLGGIQMLMMGVLGEYIWRGLDESRRRPRFILEATTRRCKRYQQALGKNSGISRNDSLQERNL